jgi:hypothetical protein
MRRTSREHSRDHLANRRDTLVGGVSLQRKNVNIFKSGRSIWWARQDSNLQPDRYERWKLAAFPLEMPIFIEF